MRKLSLRIPETIRSNGSPSLLRCTAGRQGEELRLEDGALYSRVAHNDQESSSRRFAAFSPLYAVRIDGGTENHTSNSRGPTLGCRWSARCMYHSGESICTDHSDARPGTCRCLDRNCHTGIIQNFCVSFSGIIRCLLELSIGRAVSESWAGSVKKWKKERNRHARAVVSNQIISLFSNAERARHL